MSKPKYIVWDAETGGVQVHEDRIVQWFMATADEDGNPIDTYQWFINPGVPIAQGAIDVHGLTNEWLAEHGRDPKEAFTEIRDTFLKHLDLIHVAFNMSFDLSILDAEFKRHGITSEFGTYMAENARLVDAIVIDRHFDKYRKGKRTLAAQATHYGVEYDPNALHDAKEDVRVTAQVTAKVVEKYGIPTVAEQAQMHVDWAEGFETWLREAKGDDTIEIERDWPLKKEK